MVDLTKHWYFHDKTIALAKALHLAITAPTNDKMDKAIKLADDLAQGLSLADINRAKSFALKMKG
ncbi:hypothetical protein OAF54_03230 [bacterium]|nr:hypothetical protein [bacterium]